MKTQSSLSLFIVFAITAVLIGGNVLAEERATREECIAKCREAAQMVKEKGADETIKTIMDPNGPFIWKNTYVFCFNMKTGIMLAHSQAPKLVGKMTKGVKDKKGKLLFVEYANTAKEKGEGWIDYMWPKPGEKHASPKESYVFRVPGEDLVMVAGIYKD
ncbi:MAG: hypothetical protein GY795_40450 [Desulfobacterales bacterium]|nr:hypothetical protein [Desulfobacterales bacterium]